MPDKTAGGALAGLTVIEMEGIGPAPLAAMLLADMGATVLRIQRREPVEQGIQRDLRFNLLLRNRTTIALDLKQPDAVTLVLDLLENADVLIEGFRPGVMERLGLGPDVCLARNPRLIFGRVTGWGQDGPLAQSAGHDINYLALTGALDAIGRQGQPPTPPLALLGDFAGGGLYLALGILAALLERTRSGQGQVIDAAMVDGVASLSTAFFGLAAAGVWRAERGVNLIDSGAPFYDVYACRDGRYVSVGPLERKFFEKLLALLDLPPALVQQQSDRAQWPALRQHLSTAFAQRTRDEWCALLEGTDACFAPVLSFEEAPAHAHMQARGTFIEIDGVSQPAAAPRFSRSAAPPISPVAQPLRGTAALVALSQWLSPAQVDRAQSLGLLG
ncbi:CaiB/BaiF CoA-transferase family protein [Achromobacter seleniivolatilans]|uniref:CaiB/BaiF CoA-transferase family protein n=1 Tax=Achromobacter seleniivolatilans TaxID=3047478 RepID=A0ABY9M5B2_9BURK|nr:CaiB/BaiF CoA-transferase family protein [Achromobacter sp. R39]WMD22186.1 CaiB/BaiF CoA-transferase family protein [Achromobacter sp. R39]